MALLTIFTIVFISVSGSWLADLPRTLISYTLPMIFTDNWYYPLERFESPDAKQNSTFVEQNTQETRNQNGEDNLEEMTVDLYNEYEYDDYDTWEVIID